MSRATVSAPNAFRSTLNARQKGCHYLLEWAMKSKLTRKQRERMFSQDDRHVITVYLGYKLAQIRNLIYHYQSIKIKDRTDGEKNALAQAKRAEAVVCWLFPGGRGEPQDGSNLSGQ